MTKKTRIKDKTGLRRSFTIHHVYSYRGVPMLLLNQPKRTLNYPLSRLLITLGYHRAHFAVDKIALLVLTLLTHFLFHRCNPSHHFTYNL